MNIHVGRNIKISYICHQTNINYMILYLVSPFSLVMHYTKCKKDKIKIKQDTAHIISIRLTCHALLFFDLNIEVKSYNSNLCQINKLRTHINRVEISFNGFHNIHTVCLRTSGWTKMAQKTIGFIEKSALNDIKFTFTN